MRLRNGLTPPQLVDQVLAKRIERMGPQLRFGPVADERAEGVADELTRELRIARLQLRISWATVAFEAVVIALVLGLRLLGA